MLPPPKGRQNSAQAQAPGKASNAKLFTTGRKVDVKQEEFRVQFTGLPEKAPEEPVMTIEVECDGEPPKDTEWVRRERPRRGVGI